MKLATSAQMKEMDRIAIEERGIASVTLMEHAAEGIVSAVQELWEAREDHFLPQASGEVLLNQQRFPVGSGAGDNGKRAAVFVGPGNNGGDGVAAARLLANGGWEVRVFLVGDSSKLTPDCAAMAARLPEVGLSLQKFPTDMSELCGLYAWCAGCAVFVDALFGVGLCRDVSGLFAAAIALMNSYETIPTVAADIASGLSADTGKVLGIAVHAAVTVTFSLAKPGHFADQGSLYTGKLIVHDIGIPDEILWQQELTDETIDAQFVREILPKRQPDGHKGTFGKDYILAGSVGFTGAPVFAARACVRTGAGLVTLGVPESVYPIVAGKCMEEMPYPLPECCGKLASGAYGAICEKIEGASAVLLGPGLGRSEESDALVCRLIEELPQSLVVDADGLNALGAHIDRLRRRAGRVTVLTPHDGEFARLGGDLGRMSRMEAARAFAQEYGCILVLKGHRSIVAAPDGRVAINTTGNSGMAKGGSGDVLSGMVLALLGQGAGAFEAACAAVWLHGHAGDLAAAQRGEYSMTPSDLLDQIAPAILTLL